MNALRFAIAALAVAVALALQPEDLAAQRLANNRASRLPCVGPSHRRDNSQHDTTPDDEVVASAVLPATDDAPVPPSSNTGDVPAVVGQKSIGPTLEPIVGEPVDGESGLQSPGEARRLLGGGMNLDECGPLGRHRFGDLHFPLPRPMTGASWLNRPLSAEVFSGVIFGNDLIEDNVRHQGDMFSGVRLGWDWTQYLGGETRLGFAQVGTEDISLGVELADTDIVLWDLNVLWYPTGDTRVRPYVSFGLGMAHFEFEDAAGFAHQKELVGIPIGVGLKYRAKPWFAARLDVTDNIALPNAGVVLQNNFSITLTAEFRFGGERTSYWPWNPTMQTW